MLRTVSKGHRMRQREAGNLFKACSYLSLSDRRYNNIGRDAIQCSIMFERKEDISERRSRPSFLNRFKL